MNHPALFVPLRVESFTSWQEFVLSGTLILLWFAHQRCIVFVRDLQDICTRVPILLWIKPQPE